MIFGHVYHRYAERNGGAWAVNEVLDRGSREGRARR